MTAWIVPETDQATAERNGRRRLDPRLVCMWKVDPASNRLSCVWAAPARTRQTMKTDPARHLRLVIG